jgi:hypothetical protein
LLAQLRAAGPDGRLRPPANQGNKLLD